MLCLHPSRPAALNNTLGCCGQLRYHYQQQNHHLCGCVVLIVVVRCVVLTRCCGLERQHRLALRTHPTRRTHYPALYCTLAYYYYCLLFGRVSKHYLETNKHTNEQTNKQTTGLID